MAKQAKSGGADRDGVLVWTWLIAAAVILVTVYARIRLLQVPLERDEGEFAYMGRLILEGIPPYKLAYSMKLPGTAAIYALIMAVFGQTIQGIRIGLLLANLGGAVLLFMCARRLWNTQTALIAGASYPVLTLGRAVAGPSAHATQFLVPMVLGGLLLLLKALEEDRPRLLFWSGLLMGLGFVTKQHALFFALFGGCYLLWETIRARKIGAPAVAGRAAEYAAGVVVPFAATCLVMYLTGVFDRFWFWTVTYANAYVGESSPGEGLRDMWKSIVPFLSSVSMVVLAGLGLVAVWCDGRLRRRALFATGLLIFGFLAVCPGLYFRDHYYVQVMPAVALLIGAGTAWVGQLLGRMRRPGLTRAVPLLIFAAAVAHTFFIGRQLMCLSTPVEASRIMYGASPFPEAVDIAKFIRENTGSRDTIAVLGSEPEIYFYADRLSATGYIYTYGLMETHPFVRQMQEEMIREIENARPKYIVYAKIVNSWQFKPTSDLSILHWLARYLSANYRIVGMADIVPGEETNYYWGEEAGYAAASSTNGVSILERKDN